MNISLCTLFEGNYHYGVAALANSLVASGYQGELWVGYRGPLPRWVLDAPGFDPQVGHFQAGPSLVLRFVVLDTPLHFTYYKPTFIADLLAQNPQLDTVAYIDPDIVVKCDWPALAGWFLDGGVALCEDVNFRFPARHPKRLLWREHFAPHGFVERRPLDRYFNAGFIGIPRSSLGFLDLWRRVCEVVVAYNGPKLIKVGGGAALFNSTDQDAMNFALTACDDKLNTVGADGMDFMPGGYYLSHAIGPAKPWHDGHVRRALRGFPPSLPAKAYFAYANHPIRVFTDSELARRKLNMKIAGAIGRVYRRT